MATRTVPLDNAAASAQISPGRRLAGRAAMAAWGVALIVFCLTSGFPFDRANLSVWILTGLVAASIARPWRSVARIFLDWVPFILILFLYDYSRGAAESLGGTVQVVGPILWDKALFFGTVPPVWMQQQFYDPQQIHWWESVGALIYCSHFLLVWVIAAVLYQRDRDHWFRWARALVILSFAALVTFALLPSAPPWYASEEGLLPQVDRISTRGLDPLGLSFAESLIHQGRATTNDVAAIPSLHTGFAVLVCLWFFNRVPRGHRWWLRPLLVAYPVAMLAMLVYSGEHYVVDGIIGTVFVVAVLAGLALWDRRRERAPALSPVEPDPTDSHIAG